MPESRRSSPGCGGGNQCADHSRMSEDGDAEPRADEHCESLPLVNGSSNKKKRWSVQEDEMLARVVAEIDAQFQAASGGPSQGDGAAPTSRALWAKWHLWARVASRLPGRTNGQCRSRWIDKYDPETVRGAWAAAEDQLIISLIEEKGTKWTSIAAQLPGRTATQVKNRYYAALRKKRLEDPCATDAPSVSFSDLRNSCNADERVEATVSFEPPAGDAPPGGYQEATLCSFHKLSDVDDGTATVFELA